MTVKDFYWTAAFTWCDLQPSNGRDDSDSPICPDWHGGIFAEETMTKEAEGGEAT